MILHQSPKRLPISEALVLPTKIRSLDGKKVRQMIILTSHLVIVNKIVGHKWNGIVGDLISGSADMAFAPLSVSK